MKEKTIVSAFTLTASMTCYLYAKSVQKDTVPYVMVGGFIGAILGELIAEAVKESKGDNL
jgi:uncharacterized membrane protein YfcA